MTALLTLLKAAGLHVVEQPGWKVRGNTWSVGQPEGLMQHHTAPPNPYPIKKLYGPPFYWIKANWATHEDGTVYLIAYRACNYSSGRGMKAVLTDNVRPGIPPTRNATKRGLISGNRHYWNGEHSHPGDGSPIPAVQLEAIIVASRVMADHFGLSWRNTISHAEHTSRKIDPRWNGSNRIAIEQIRQMMSERSGEDDMLPLRPTSAPEDIRSLQGRLNTAYGAGLTEDTNWGAKTSTAIKGNLLGFTGSDEAGDRAVIDGQKVNARMWNGLLKDLIKKYGSPPLTGVTEDDVKAIINQSSIKAPR